MPRKKTDAAASPAPDAAKLTPAPSTEASTTDAPSTDAKPKATRSRRKAVAETSAPAAVVTETVSKPSSRKKAEPPAQAPAETKPTKKRTPRVSKTAEKVETTPDSTPIDWATEVLPEPIWRARGTKSEPITDAPVDAELVAQAEIEVDGESEANANEEGEGGRRRRRRRRGGRSRGDDRTPETTSPDAVAAPAPVASPAPIVTDANIVTREVAEGGTEFALDNEALVVAMFRPKQGAAPDKKPQTVVETQPAKRTETVPEATRPEPRPEPRAEVPRRERVAPKAPEKALIPIPPDAPQVVVRNGIPTLVRDGRVYPPIFFFGNPADERRAENVLEEVRMAAESGVHLHSYLVQFEVNPAAVDEAASIAAYMLAQSVRVDPESQVLFRISFQTPRGWEDRYPDSRYRTADGETAEPSVCDDDFWGVARTCLERFIKQLCLLDLKDHILGLHLERGEWFLPEGHGYDTSRAATRKFRDWARTRYVDDEVTLRASWFDGAARFDTIQVPIYTTEGPAGERFIRSSRRQRRYVDYHLFLSDATVQRIGDLAYAAKAASEGKFLIGVSYGYTFEWSHPDSCHLSLGKLLRTPEIDFIAGPPSYRNREPGGTAPFPAPIDSFALNGKLYLSEEDYKTSLSTGHEPDDFNPRLKTPQALDAVHWRGVGTALAHASGVAWMDLWGNGWLKTHSVWERARQVREALTDRMGSPLGDPEVAVFIDERALAYLVDSHAFALLVQNVRESILRAGVSAGFYLLSDLAHREKFPESKLYLFLNAWDIRPELRSAIKSRLQRNNKVLFWLYAAGLFDAGRDSLERAREVTGIALKPQPYYSKSGTTILNRRHPLSEAFPDRSVVGGTKLEPSYFAIPEGATVLGEYSQTGLPSFVVREFNEGPAETHWTSVFLGEPLVNPALIRALAQMAGAHVWNFHEDVVHVRPPFCTVHCAGAGPRTLTLPAKHSAYNILRNEWDAVDTGNVRFHAVDGSTHCFLVGPKDDLEGLLRQDPSGVLRMDQLPPREANVRHDVSNFDVPIMRLDEWIEGSEGDDNADEWFLRPPKVEEELPAPAVETPERVGRRRRRRRGGRGDHDDRPEANGNGHAARTTDFSPPEPDVEDFGVSVVFRKRD